MNFLSFARKTVFRDIFRANRFCTKVPVNQKSAVKIVSESDTGVCLPEVVEEAQIAEKEVEECVDEGGQGESSGAVPRTPLVRGEPGEVIWAFVPREWYDAFVPKTGATGFYTFLFTTGTYLISKEIIIMEHNFYNGLSSAVMWGLGIIYVGPQVSKMLDREVDKYEKAWLDKSAADKQYYENVIVDEKILQFQADGQTILVEAKRENIFLQLEECFRIRQMEVYQEVVKRLDYQVAIADVHKRIAQRNLVEYVKKEVLKALSPDMHNQIIWKCLDDIVKDMEKEEGTEKGGT